jgi:hypothetical protein
MATTSALPEVSARYSELIWPRQVRCQRVQLRIPGWSGHDTCAASGYGSVFRTDMATTRALPVGTAPYSGLIWPRQAPWQRVRLGTPGWSGHDNRPPKVPAHVPSSSTMAIFYQCSRPFQSRNNTDYPLQFPPPPNTAVHLTPLARP